MSLQHSQLLVPRETLETQSIEFQDLVRDLDIDILFKDIIGLEAQKRTFMDSIKSIDPVHHIIVGEAGGGKSTFLKCIDKYFKDYSLFIDSTTSSGIGMAERIHERGHKLRFLLVDEIEKFNSNDREVFLGILEGTLARELKNVSMQISDLNVWLFATCNDLKKMQKEEKPLLSRCDIVHIPPLDFDTFLLASSKRLLREHGIESEDMGRYIARRVYSDLGEHKDIRRCIRIARKAYARAGHNIITKDIVDEVVLDLKSVMHNVVKK